MNYVMKSKKAFRRMVLAVYSTVLCFLLAAPVMAQGHTGSVDENIDPTNAIWSMAWLLLTMLQGAGVIVLIFGAVNFISSFGSQGDTNHRIQGILAITAGILFISLKYILKLFGVTIN